MPFWKFKMTVSISDLWNLVRIDLKKIIKTALYPKFIWSPHQLYTRVFYIQLYLRELVFLKPIFRKKKLRYSQNYNMHWRGQVISVFMETWTTGCLTYLGLLEQKDHILSGLKTWNLFLQLWRLEIQDRVMSRLSSGEGFPFGFQMAASLLHPIRVQERERGL